MNEAGMLVIGFLILAGALGSFACESLRHFSRSRLDHACRRIGRPQRLGVVLRHAGDAFLATELATVVAVGVLAALAGIRFAADLGTVGRGSGWLAVWIEPAFLVAGFVVAFFVVPWCLSHVAGERFLARAWPALALLMRFARPYTALVRRLDTFLHRLWGMREPGGGDVESLVREIKSVVDLGQRQGVIDAQARRMIERVIALQQDDVGAVMTSRTDMDCIAAETPLEEARRLMVEAGHSRMPVIGGSTDDVIGILYAKDLLRHLSGANAGQGLHLRDVVREPFYVPQTISIDKLLESMKRRGVHIAMVIDEYSGIAGLVTMEDVLEQIVGEIVDEYDTAEDQGIRSIGAGSLEVSPRVRIDDLDEQFGFELPTDEDYDTIGGFVYAQLGRIPKKRESFTWKQLRVTVLDADKRRIHKLRLDDLAPQRPRASE